MCIDDYQFRHYSAIRGKDIRRFVITNEDQIQRTYLVNISQFEENGEIALCKILLYLSNKGLPIAERIFYLSKYDVFLHPASLCKVPFNALNEKEINLRSVLKQKMQFLNQQLKNSSTTTPSDTYCTPNFDTKQYYGFQLQGNCCCSCVNNKVNEKQDLELRNLLTQTIDQEYQQEIEQLQYIPKQQKYQEPKVEVKEKRWKQPERKIGEVLYAVKKWRKLYEAKKMKLVESAKFIGISKKSLDDYFLVLRVGEIHGFNYADNLESKMGDLRAFIRSKEQKVGGKLPKQLKSFNLLPEINLNQFMDLEASREMDNVLCLNNNCEMEEENGKQ